MYAVSLNAFTSNARLYFFKRRVNRDSHSTLLGRLIFLYHLEHQKIQIPSWLHSTFKDLSNEYSHAQIRAKTKKLWHRQVGEKKTGCCQESMSRHGKVCRDKQYVATDVATSSSMLRPMSRQAAVCRDIDDQCRDKKALSRQESFVATRMLQKP